MKEDRNTRALTKRELGLLKQKRAAIPLAHEAAALRLGVSGETLRHALNGDRVQYAKRRRMLEARVDDETEVMDLQASEIACAVADAWFTYKYRPVGFQESRAFADAMERLELITRPSAMRKVRP